MRIRTIAVASVAALSLIAVPIAAAATTAAHPHHTSTTTVRVEKSSEKPSDKSGVRDSSSSRDLASVDG